MYQTISIIDCSLRHQNFYRPKNDRPLNIIKLYKITCTKQALSLVYTRAESQGNFPAILFFFNTLNECEIKDNN